MSTRSEIIGQSQSTPFVAFGDDSQYDGVLVFSYVFVPRTRLRRVLRDISGIKRKFQFPIDAAIHCRELFSGQQRSKQGLGHLSQSDVQAIVQHAVTLINQHNVFLRYAFAQTERLSGIFGESNSVELENVLDGSKHLLPAVFGPKGIIGILAQACFASSPDGSQGPIASQCEIYAAADKTKVRFIGNQRQRADSLIPGFSDIGAPEGTVFQIKPTIAGSDFSPIFELADLAAYMCSHAIHGNGKQPFFHEALSRVKYWARSEFLLSPDQAQWEVPSPN